MTLSKIIEKYVERIIVDYPESDKIHIELLQFAEELNKINNTNMEGLKNVKFKGIDWARNSLTVEGTLTVRDYKTLEPALKEVNRNGYVVCIENEDGVHIVIPDSVEIVF